MSNDNQDGIDHSDRLALIGTLSAGLIHEINTPLACVMLCLDQLSEEFSARQVLGVTNEPDPLKGAVDNALRAAERVRGIVHDVSQFLRKSGNDRGPIDVAAAIESALRISAFGFGKHIRIVKDFGHSGLVLANPLRLEQVFVNLFVNAAHAMDEVAGRDHQLRVSTRTASSNEAIVIDVEDTGCGIAPEHIGRIFESYFTTKPPVRGTGLGLTICRQIIQALDGEFDVESEKGQGTVFRITLPVTSETG